MQMHVESIYLGCISRDVSLCIFSGVFWSIELYAQKVAVDHYIGPQVDSVQHLLFMNKWQNDHETQCDLGLFVKS
jgi:hypothetical protein